jgi:hypothetical protein
MRPAIRPDVYCAATHYGAFILTPPGPVRLTGASIAAWIAGLAPYLDGRSTLAELTASLSQQRREMVQQVVNSLHQAGVVRDLDRDGAGTGAAPAPGDTGPLTVAEVDEYAAEIGYLGHFLDSCADAFAGYRAVPALVVGSGPLLGPLVSAALRSGIRQLRVAATSAVLAELAEPSLRDPAQQLTYHAVTDLQAGPEVAELVADAGLVLHAAETGADTGVLEQVCAAAGVWLAQAVTTDREVWLVPVGTDPAGWSAVAGRLATAPGHPAPEPPGQVPADPDPAELLAAATRLVQGGFQALTGVAEPGPRTHLIRVPRVGWAPQRHRFVPHPHALPVVPTAAAALPERVAALAAGARLTEQEFSRRAVRCLDPRLGLFTFPDNDWEQLPLQVCEAVVADPVGWLPAGSPPRTVGSGFTEQAARCEAALRALARYATLMVDPRRLVDPWSHGQFAATPTADPQPAAVWGYEVDAADRVRLVPATRAFPVLTGPSPDPPVGVGAGYDWAEAVTSALVSHALAQTLATLGHAASPYPRVDLATAAIQEEPGERCRWLLTELGELPVCVDLTGPLGVPTFGFCQGGTTVAVTAGATAEVALSDGLRCVLRAMQARIHGQPGYSPRPAPPIPARLLGEAPRTHRPHPEPVTPQRLAARVRATGRVAVAVPLDHDQAVTDILPYLVQVVVVDG